MSAEVPTVPESAAPPAAVPADVQLGEDGQPLSKGEIKRRAKEAEKAAKAAERAKKDEEAKAKKAAEEANVRVQSLLLPHNDINSVIAMFLQDTARDNYGPLPLHQSSTRPRIPRTQFPALSAALAEQKVLIRARVHNARAQGAKMLFLTLRQQTLTLQGVLTIRPGQGEDGGVSKQMLKWASGIPLESIVLVEGVIKPAEVRGCTVGDCEISISKIHAIVEVGTRLPFGVEEASKTEEEYAKENSQFPRVNLDTRLDNRIMDLRTPTNQAIFRLQHGICKLFREHLTSIGFIEIHSPKLQGAATESGASVFEVSYFKGKAYLAQSPQLAKQMCIAGDMERVFEIAPVFRAENSFTHRHMTEFVGLDLEMAIEEHYHEALDVLDSVFKTIFKGIKENYKHELEAIERQFPAEEFTWLEETLVLNFKDGVRMLKEVGAKDIHGNELKEDEDLSTANEKWLGQLVKAKYHTDYFVLDKFPLSVRPFYTMPDPEDATLSNSYDFFMRGEEILSGAQRVHDPEMLMARMREVGIDPESMKAYVDAFRLGAPPHAGGGIGLERVLMLFLKLGEIRRASLFPRDPKRLAP